MAPRSIAPIASLLLGALFAPACGGGGGDGVQDVVIVPVRRGTGITELCGTVTSDNVANPGGTILVGDSDTNHIARGIYTYALPGLPAGAEIVRVDLTTALGGGSQSVFDGLGPMVVDLVNVGDVLTGADYSAGLRVPDLGTMFTTDTTSARTLDVTAAVRADYGAGFTQTSFRFRFTSGTDLDGVEDLVSLLPPGALPDVPRLEVEYRMP